MEAHLTVDVIALREGIAADLAQMASPLTTRLQTVDELLAERLEDLASLREVRIEIVRALRPLVGEDAIPIEPGRKAKSGPTARKRPSPSSRSATHPNVSDSRVEQGLAYARSNGGEFKATDIATALEMSNATGNAIVNALLEREQIRLVRQEPGPGRARLYRVVG